VLALLGCARLRAASPWPLTRPSFDGLCAFRDSDGRDGTKNGVLPVRTKNVCPHGELCGSAIGGAFAGVNGGAFGGADRHG